MICELTQSAPHLLLASDPSGGAYSYRMPTRDNEDRAKLLQGAGDLLILRTLLPGPQHGQGIARSIQRESDDVFLVDHGSLYLALQRLEEQNLVDASWGVSDNNRRAVLQTHCQKPKPAYREDQGMESHRRGDGAYSGRSRIGGVNVFRRKRRSLEDFRAEIESHLAHEADDIADEIRETDPGVDAEAAAARVRQHRCHPGAMV